MEDEYLTVKEVADLLKCGKSTILERVRKGTFPKPVKKIGTRWSKRGLLEWMAA